MHDYDAVFITSTIYLIVKSVTGHHFSRWYMHFLSRHQTVTVPVLSIPPVLLPRKHPGNLFIIMHECKEHINSYQLIVNV